MVHRRGIVKCGLELTVRLINVFINLSGESLCYSSFRGAKARCFVSSSTVVEPHDRAHRPLYAG